jgi:hypothetical protein
MIIRLRLCRLVAMGQLMMIFHGGVSILEGSSIGTLICSRIGAIGSLISIMILVLLFSFPRLICSPCKVSTSLKPSVIGYIKPKDHQENSLEHCHLFMYTFFSKIRFPALGFEFI